MLKNKSIDYIFGMITGISVSITFWACTNTDLIASNDDASNELPNNTIQQVEITNWSDMPAVSISGTPSVSISPSGNTVAISSSDNNIDCNIDFPSSMNVAITNQPTVQFSSLGNNVEINGSIDCNVDFPASMDVKVTNDPTVKISSTYNNVDCNIDDSQAVVEVKVVNASWDPVHVTIED